MSDCIFCKIISGDIPSSKVYEDDKIVAFRDVNPQMPVHVLFVPKMHIASANGINEENTSVIADVFAKIPVVAKELGVADSGYRIINNCGKNAGQTVNHIHFHLLAGENMGEKLV